MIFKIRLSTKKYDEFIKELKKIMERDEIVSEFNAILYFLLSIAYQFQSDKTPAIKNLNLFLMAVGDLPQEGKQFVSIELIDFLIEIIAKDTIPVLDSFLN